MHVFRQFVIATACAMAAVAALSIALHAQTSAPNGTSAPATEPPATETVNFDLSSRSVTVAPGFTGINLITFGVVGNSRQQSAEQGYYDIVVVIEGARQEMTLQKLGRAGLFWRPARSVVVEAPSYYGIASTKPLDEIAGSDVLASHKIGFDHVEITLTDVPPSDHRDVRDAVVRLMRRDGLYRASEYEVSFFSASLFRARVVLPSNVQTGKIDFRTYLLSNGQVLSSNRQQLDMVATPGLETVLQSIVKEYPLRQGAIALIIVAVALALAQRRLWRQKPAV